MIARSVSFDELSFGWLEALSKEKGLTFSALTCQVIAKYRKMIPEIRKQEALRKLREAASELYHDCGLDQDAIMAFAGTEAGGLK